MPWKIESVMEQRLQFVIEARQQGATMSELCRRYGISRETGYKWLKRYESKLRLEALQDQTRRPHHSPQRTSAEQEQKVLAVLGGLRTTMANGAYGWLSFATNTTMNDRTKHWA